MTGVRTADDPPYGWTCIRCSKQIEIGEAWHRNDTLGAGKHHVTCKAKNPAQKKQPPTDEEVRYPSEAEVQRHGSGPKKRKKKKK